LIAITPASGTPESWPARRGRHRKDERLRYLYTPPLFVALLAESEYAVVNGAAGSRVCAAVCAERRARLVAAKPASMLAELLRQHG
jgi:hypothetical protein